jgi:hypothetical protein
MTISGIDMTNTTGPITTRNGAPYAFLDLPNYNYQGVYWLWYWVPMSDIDNSSATLTGAYYKNKISGPGGAIWDPSSTGGLSNYGTGTEPQTNNEPYHYDLYGTGNALLLGSDQTTSGDGLTPWHKGGRHHGISLASKVDDWAYFELG